MITRGDNLKKALILENRLHSGMFSMVLIRFENVGRQRDLANF